MRSAPRLASVPGRNVDPAPFTDTDFYPTSMGWMHRDHASDSDRLSRGAALLMPIVPLSLLFVLSANPHRPARDAAMMPGC